MRERETHPREFCQGMALSPSSHERETGRYRGREGERGGEREREREIPPRVLPGDGLIILVPDLQNLIQVDI